MKFCLRENITTQKVTSSLKYLGLSDKRLKNQSTSPINREIINSKDINRML